MIGRIAVLDDDEELLGLLKLVLTRAKYKVDLYPTPGKFFDGIMRARPDLCVVDVQLPGMDGRDVIRILRSNAQTRTTPAILISGLSTTPADVVRGVEGGADEYFTKPLDLDLFVVRIGNLIARSTSSAPPPAESIKWGNIIIFPDEHRVTVKSREIPITRLEMLLLLAFFRQPNRVLPRSWLLQTVWESSPSVTTRTVDKHVESLRRKFPALAARLETVVGIGYLFRP